MKKIKRYIITIKNLYNVVLKSKLMEIVYSLANEVVRIDDRIYLTLITV